MAEHLEARIADMERNSYLSPQQRHAVATAASAGVAVARPQ